MAALFSIFLKIFVTELRDRRLFQKNKEERTCEFYFKLL
jgi:hypothetical protein